MVAAVACIIAIARRFVNLFPNPSLSWHNGRSAGRPETSALKQAIHKHLRDKKLIVLPEGLQPAYISTVEGYHTHLPRVLLLPEAAFLSGSIQM